MKPTPPVLNGSSRSVNARLADVEPTVEALLTRCDDLLIAGKVLAARVCYLEARCQAFGDGLDNMDRALTGHGRQLIAQGDTVWQRLRWVFRG